MKLPSETGIMSDEDRSRPPRLVFDIFQSYSASFANPPSCSPRRFANVGGCLRYTTPPEKRRRAFQKRMRSYGNRQTVANRAALKPAPHGH